MTDKVKSLIAEHGIRNGSILTVAPTGTVSILSNNCSSGIEPMFSPAYERRWWVGDNRNTEIIFHPLFKKFMDEGRNISNFVGSHDLTVREHMEVQKIIQKHIDSACSKTINMPENYPIEEMSKVWLEYLPFLKGTTFYRTNSRKFIDANGKEQEPPLKPLDIDKAVSLYNKDVKAEGIEDQCAGGSCDL
jgi:ribonucleoside-diphosphate reductase alpha chain